MGIRSFCGYPYAVVGSSRRVSLGICGCPWVFAVVLSIRAYPRVSRIRGSSGYLGVFVVSVGMHITTIGAVVVAVAVAVAVAASSSGDR